MQQHCYFGGTFNPIHIGHARLALECQAHLACQFHFVPCAVPPLKDRPQVASDHRLAMVTAVVEELNTFCGQNFHIESWELNQSGCSYTVRTLEHLRESYPTRPLTWVIGMDSFVSLDQWQQWQTLSDLANFLVLNRPGYDKADNKTVFDWARTKFCELGELGLSGGIAFMNSTPLAISSSDIRAQIQKGLNTKYLLPEPVRDYIDQHQLYT